MRTDRKVNFTKKRNTGLTIDEDIEFDDDIKIDETLSLGKKQVELPKKPQTSKPTIAGILLLIAFFLNLMLPISYFLLINDIETATGDTSLKGKVRGTNNEPIDNVTVSILGTNLSTETDSYGNYSFNTVPVGEHEIQFTKIGYRQVKVRKVLFSKNILSQNEESYNIIDVPGELTSSIQIGSFDGPFNETVIVRDFLNSTLFGTVSNLTGVPVSNIQLEILDTKLKTQTDENGHYTFNNIQPGIITIQITQTGSSNKTTFTILYASNSSTELDITFDEQKDQYYDEVRSKTGNIIGNILDSNQLPIENINVFLKIDEEIYPNNIFITGKDGGFIFNGVPIGVYEIMVTGLDFYITRITNVTIEIDSNITIPPLELTKLKSPIIIEEEISSEYTYYCILILIIFSLITLGGAISAFQRKRYSLVFVGAIFGMVPVVLPIMSLRLDICLAGVFGLVALVLLVFSRNEFTFK